MSKDRYIDNLITVLGDELQMTGKEIADILWLAGQRYQYDISQVALRNSPNLSLNNIQIDKFIDSPIPEETIEETPEDPLIKESANIPIPQTDKIPVVSPRANNSRRNIENKSTLPIRVPDAPAIREPLKFAYALRSLMQKVPSGKRDILDENATVQIIAETNIWQLVLKPELEPWLDLAVIIDESPSMSIWGHTIKDFKRLVEHYGIFRHVHIWGLVTDKTDPTKEQVKILPRMGSRRKQRFANYQELIDPNGRRLILIVSDCVSNIWHNGAMLEPLQGWSKYQPVVILQMLPDWFWLRTGLGNGASVLLKSAGRGATNYNLLNHNLLIDELLLRKDFNLATGIKVPVINLEPDLAEAWSQVLIGKNDVLTAGFVLPSPQQWDDLQDELRSLNLPDDLTEESFDAKDRVDHFRQTASPIARKLAGLLAAAPLINLPVVRIIQETLLSQSNQVHVAEVFLGGLLRADNRTEYDGEEALNNPDGVVYNFMDNEIRQILLRDAPVSDSATVFNAVSLYFANRLNKSLDDFVAFLQAPGIEQDASAEMVAFAELSIQVLKGMGGQYAEFADRMQDSLIGSEISQVSQEYFGDISQNAQTEQQNIRETNSTPPQEISVPAKYEKLQKLLAAGEWKEADQETATVMLQVAGREKEGWLNIDSIENFPCEDLRTIDQLWVKYSNGRFGFSVQKNIWLECGGKVDYETECKLGDRLGWRVKGEWISYDDGTFNMKALPGHLPSDFRLGGCGVGVRLGAFFSRIKSCKL